MCLYPYYVTLINTLLVGYSIFVPYELYEQAAAGVKVLKGTCFIRKMKQ